MKHRCALPVRDVMISSPTATAKVGTTPALPVGSVWTCECGRTWTVRWHDGRMGASSYTAAHAYWSPATWWERRGRGSNISTGHAL